MWRPGGAFAPVQDRLGVVVEPVAALARGPGADLVQPAAQVGRGRDVGGDGDQPGGHLGGLAGEVEQRPAQGLLGGAGPVRGAPGVGRAPRAPTPASCPEGRAPHRRAPLDAASPAPVEARGGLGAQAGGVGVRRQRAPGVVEVGADVGGELAHLGLGQQRRVVLRVALGGEPVALDGVGEDHGGAGVVDGVEGVEQGAEVVPAEVADGGVHRVVVDGLEQRRDLRRVVGVLRRALAGDALAQLGRGAAQQPLVLGVGHGVDAPAQRGPAVAGVEVLEQPAVLDGDDLPAGGVEQPVQPGRPRCRGRPGPATGG